MIMCPCIFKGSTFILPSYPQILKGIHDPPLSHHQKEKVNDQLKDSDPLGECEFL